PAQHADRSRLATSPRKRAQFRRHRDVDDASAESLQQSRRSSAAFDSGGFPEVNSRVHRVRERLIELQPRELARLAHRERVPEYGVVSLERAHNRLDEVVHVHHAAGTVVIALEAKRAASKVLKGTARKRL